jgi:acyl carrier protein
LALIREGLENILGGRNEVVGEADLRDLGIDSAKALELAGMLEEQLGCEFSNNRLERVKTVDDLAELILESVAHK